MNAARLPRIGLIFSKCTTASAATLPPARFVRQVFPLAKPGRLAIGRQSAFDVSLAGSVVPPDELMEISHGDDYQQLTLRIEPSVLNAALATLIDSPTGPLAFDPGDERDMRRSRFVRQTAIDLAREINVSGADMGLATLAETEQSLIVRFLFYTHHNYSAKLLETPAAVSANAVDRVEDYIHENWRAPLDFEALSRAADTSVRSLFRTFKQMRDYTPSEYAKRVRLEHARSMILDDDGASIMGIALKCGFHNIGRFAEDYRRQFGELPSQTRKQSR